MSTSTLAPSAPLFASDGNLTDDATRLLGYFAGRYARRRHLERADLFQETALVLLCQRTKYDPSRGCLSNWIRFAALVAARRLSRWRSDEGTTIDETFPGREPDPAEGLERTDLGIALRRAVDALPYRKRFRIVRRFGLDGREPTTFADEANPRSVAELVRRDVRALAESPWLRSFAPSAN